MLAKRIIPCLDIKDGRCVKGVNFVGLKDAGDPIELAQRYSDLGGDELVFLDISATLEGRKTMVELVKAIAQNIQIPFTVGGGVKSVDEAKLLLDNGADKIALNSAAVLNPELISQLANEFGSQCVVLAIDAKWVNGAWKVFIKGGTEATDLTLFEWAKEGVKRGAGEILFTSMDNDGSKAGFHIEALKTLDAFVNVPVIASGGAGAIAHFVDLFTKTNVSAGLAASIFHYGEVQIPKLKKELINNKIIIR